MPDPTKFAATRETALQRLDTFVPQARHYSRSRNSVMPGHPNGSRLSPAISHGLIGPEECEAAVLACHAPSSVEKFVQELYWRRYWKAWLSLRPGVWHQYRQSLEKLTLDPAAHEVRQHAKRCENGESKVAIMNYFAHELTTTGYLHNHARMWFAGWWIHVERLPWELGADFMFRHLLDADAASNTLSWRWVAGLQTPGKTYLPRRSNIERYLAPEILRKHRDGLDLLAHPRAADPATVRRPEITHPVLKNDPIDPRLATGIWMHPEDLRPELGPLANLEPKAILLTGHAGQEEAGARNSPRMTWLGMALEDSQSRASAHFQAPVLSSQSSDLPLTLRQWASGNKLKQIAAMRPEVGPLADQIPAIQKALSTAGVRLRLVNRQQDLDLRPFATAGYFGFWNKTRNHERNKPINH